MQTDLDPASGYHVRTIRSMPDYSEFQQDIALIVGDVLGAARAALDHSVWHIARQHIGGDPAKPTRITFPICDSLRTFEDDGSAKALRPQIPIACCDIIERAQPYNPYADAGPHRHPLAVLRDLCNHDKHRLVTTVLLLPKQWTTPNDWPVGWGDMSDFSVGHVVANHGKPMTRGLEVIRERLPGAASHIEDAGVVTPDVAFLDGGEMVGPALKRCLSFVDGVLRDFERVLPPAPIAL